MRMEISHLSVTAATVSLLNMHSHVPKEVSPPSGTMKSAILWPISLQKCVARCALNPICSQLRLTNCLDPLPIHRMGRGSANGVCSGRFEKTFLMCESSTPTPALARTRHFLPVTESMRRRKNQLINRGYLFSWPQDEMGREATCFYKHLACMLAQKWDHPYCTTLWWLRCRLTFSLIPSAIQALQGARSSRDQAAHPPAATDLAIPYYTRFVISLSHPSFPLVLYIHYHLLYISLFFLFHCITCSACVCKKKINKIFTKIIYMTM